MTQAEPHQPQTLAGGRYLLVEPIGEGGMATVYRGFDQRLQVWRAVKVLNPRYSSSKKLKARFDTEAQTMALLEHPNIVRVYDVGSVGDISYIVMELVEGGTLVDWLERHGAMPTRLALHAIEMVCNGISAAHAKGVIHRDIKPHNVLVTVDGTCRVTDFGIARVGDADQSLTKTGAVMGTWGYMAPEQRSDAKNVDERADVYAVAATLYTLVTNRIPMDLFAADRDKSVMSGVPEVLFEVLTRATEYAREDRYPSVEALRQALAETAATLPDTEMPPLACRRPDWRGPPTPDLIARATPLVPEGGLGPAAPTILPHTGAGATTGFNVTEPGATPIQAPIRDDETLDFGRTEPERERRRGIGMWLVAAFPLVVGLGLLVFAGVIAVPVVLAGGLGGSSADPVEDSGVGQADPDPVVGETEDTDAVVEADPDPPVATNPDPPVIRTPDPPVVRNPDPPVVRDPEPPADTDVPTTTTEPDPPVGTADDPQGGTTDAGVNITVTAPVEQCLNVRPPPAASIGANAQFQANVCDDRPDVVVTLWYRPAGTTSWQSVGMPKRIGAFRAVVQVDERFASGIEYYVETDGVTHGSRSAPQRVAVQ